MASPIPGLGSGQQTSVRPGTGAPASSDSRARAESKPDRGAPSPVSASVRAELLSRLPEADRHRVVGILSQTRGDSDLDKKLEEATRRAEDLQKTLAQGRAGIANQFMEQLDELLSTYLLIVSLAVMAGRPGMVEHFAGQAERITGMLPGWVADARAGIEAGNGDASATAEQTRNLQILVASITAKARALGNGLAYAARISPDPESDNTARSAAAILSHADAAEKTARPDPTRAIAQQDAFAASGVRGGSVSFQV